ncbi:MAG: hypothetical protein ABIU97_03160 [Dehalococcoidia bacterium]
MRRLILLAVLGLTLLSACESQSLTSTDIVEDIPWSPPESDNYRVLDDSGDEVGTLTTTIESADNGALSLRQDFDFPDAGFVNSAEVIVDEDSVQPRSVSFQIQGPEGDLMCGAAYVDGKVIAERVGEDETRTDELAVPQIAYDSWSDLFLWRTIAFAEGYSVEYTDILSCTLDRTQKLGVTLKVAEREEIEVPAGTFETWRLEIESGGAGQTAWYATDESRRLIKYDNGREVFELTE